MTQSKIEKIASIDDEIKQLRERQKQLLQQHNQQERKDRIKRLCKRMGLFESMLPDTIPLTDEQFKTFLEKTVLTDMASKILAEIVFHPILSTQSKPTEAVRGGGITQEQDEGKANKGNWLIAFTLVRQGRTYIPHECGMCGLPTAFCTYRHKRHTVSGAIKSFFGFSCVPHKGQYR